MKIILLGPPGAGKGTQAEKISAQYHIPHIATGDIFRANIKKGTALGKRVKTFIDKGLLVPDDLALDLVVDRIRKEDCKEGFVLDGFPRTLIQAKQLDRKLNKRGEKLDFAVSVDVPDEIIVARMAGRCVCVKCGTTYHSEVAPSKVSGICDVCGGKLVRREDDRPETVKKRLAIFHDLTQPLIQYYAQKGILRTIDGTASIDEIFFKILQILVQSSSGRWDGQKLSGIGGANTETEYSEGRKE